MLVSKLNRFSIHMALIFFPLFFQRKSLQDEKRGKRNAGEAESSAAEDDEKEMNLDNFMTLDSVGDVDGMNLFLFLFSREYYFYF